MVDFLIATVGGIEVYNKIKIKGSVEVCNKVLWI